MSVLTIHKGSLVQQVEFSPPRSLSELLRDIDADILQPCGGRGVCGKCAVFLAGSVSEPNAAEVKAGTRLACQAVITGDAEATIPVILPMQQIETGSAADLFPTAPMCGHYGAAVDIGTTTIALLLYDLSSGHCLGSASMLNPQTSIAADVIGRIEASLKGDASLLCHQAAHAVTALLASACASACISAAHVTSLTITGNTTMLYLLNQYDPAALSHAPFAADLLFGCESVLFNKQVYLPHCLHAFVGADTSCAILASGLIEKTDTALLCDVGTNGELALWHKNILYIASTAAGPAFEGAGIHCGCASVPGAIDKVAVSHGELVCSTIGDIPAAGICGSGLVDAIACLLQTEALDETGYLEDAPVHLQDDVILTQSDVRAVQLAKAAIHAGIISLLDAAGCSVEEIGSMYLAGGFGSHLNLQNAAKIGLFPPELIDRIHVIGNAALDGAARLLLDTSGRETLAQMISRTKHIRLDGNPVFSDNYINAMLFGEE